jgi:nucleoid DNA-binding protein
MNKREIVAEMAKVLDSNESSRRALDALLDTVSGALKQKQSVSLAGFGSFKVEKRNARTGRNPKTGEPIQIKARNVLKFSPAKALKDAVN